MRRGCACRARTAGRAGGTLVSGIALVLVPKCPACLAGQLALLTGVGISAGPAAWLRWALLLGLSATLANCVWKLWRRPR